MVKIEATPAAITVFVMVILFVIAGVLLINVFREVGEAFTVFGVQGLDKPVENAARVALPAIIVAAVMGIAGLAVALIRGED